MLSFTRQGRDTVQAVQVRQNTFTFMYDKFIQDNMYPILSQSVRFCRLYIKKHFGVFFRFTLYYSMPKSQLRWTGLICRTHQHYRLQSTDCQTSSGQIPGDKPEKRRDGYGRKDFQKGRVLRQDWKILYDNLLWSDIFGHSCVNSQPSSMRLFVFATLNGTSITHHSSQFEDLYSPEQSIPVA